MQFWVELKHDNKKNEAQVFQLANYLTEIPEFDLNKNMNIIMTRYVHELEFGLYIKYTGLIFKEQK
jgi:hypothetical protein